MHEIDGSTVWKPLQRRRGTDDAQLIPAHVRHLQPRHLVEAHDVACKKIQAPPRAIFVIGREEHLQSKANAEKRRATAEMIEQRLRQTGLMTNFDVLGNVVVLTPKENAERIFERIPATVNLGEQWAAGASRLPNEAGLIYKVVGMETSPVRAKVRQLWSLVRREVVGACVPPEFPWK